MVFEVFVFVFVFILGGEGNGLCWGFGWVFEYFFKYKYISIIIWLMDSAANWQVVYLGEMVSAIQYVTQRSSPYLCNHIYIYEFTHTM